MTAKQTYIMGIDLGTQSAKVVIFRPDGTVVSEGKQALRPLSIPQPQLAEHPDDDLWDALRAACNAAMTEFCKVGKSEQICAVGLCTIRCCRVVMRDDGSLAHPVISWMDKRLNDPYKYENDFGDVRFVTTTSGYITHRLTGETKDTSANYIGWWPMDDETFDWSADPKSFARCGLKREMLFDVVQPGEILGQVTRAAAEATGLPEGLPVVATAHDKAVEMLGAGLLDSSVAQISLGTYIGAFVPAEKRVTDAKGFWTFQSSQPGGYMYECMGVRRGMWTVSWFRDQFGGAAADAANAAGISIEEYFNRAGVKVPPGSDGLITIHDWAPPPEAPYRKGAMLGFDGRHTSAHMYRSLLEGIGLTLYNSMRAMLDELQFDLKKIVVSGGGAQSDLFMQIFADIFGVVTVRNKMSGSAAVGCAMNAGVATLVYDNYDEAVKALVHRGDEFTPSEKNRDVYQRINGEVYSKAHQHLDPLLVKLSPLVDE